MDYRGFAKGTWFSHTEGVPFTAISLDAEKDFDRLDFSAASLI